MKLEGLLFYFFLNSFNDIEHLTKRGINQAIEEISVYFPKEEIEADYRKFQDLVLDRIKTAMYLGSLKV